MMGMWNFIRRSFKRKLLFCFVLVALLPMALSCSLLVQTFKAKLSRDYEKRDLQQAAIIQQAMAGLLGHMDQTTRALSLNQEIIRHLNGKAPGNRNQVYGLLYGQTTGLRDVASFDLYGPDGICRYSTGTDISRHLPTDWGILKAAASHPQDLAIWAEKNLPGQAGTCLRAARAILGPGDQLAGFAVATIGDRELNHALKGMVSSLEGVCIVNRFWETAYAAGTAESEDIGNVLRDQLFAGKAIPSSWHGQSIYISPLGATGLYIIFLSPKAFTAHAIQAMYKILLAMAAASLFLSVLAAAKMSKSLAAPLTCLSQAMGQVQNGNLKAQIPVGRMDELGQLSQNFNAMAKELMEHVERQVRQQKEMDQISIAMIHAQLNPHFLYNTLDTMKWVAKANHIPDMATMAAKLARILRVAISQAQYVTLKEELALADDYAQIQQIRFQGKFTFTYDLPGQLKDCLVLKLMVQPMVENAVLHGLADREGGHVWVKAFEEEGLIHIQVSDDGCGIPEDVLSALNAGCLEKLAGHIGFYNVDTMIRLHYGQAYGLKGKRLDGGGAQVTITIPMGKEDGHGIG